MRAHILCGLRSIALHAGVLGLSALVGCSVGQIDGAAPESETGGEGPLPTPSTPVPTDSGSPETKGDASPGSDTSADSAGEDVQVPVAPPLDSTGYPADDPAAPDTHALSADLAEHLTITEVASYQSLKVSLARDGAPVARPKWEKIFGASPAVVPIVAGRDALLRIFVKPEAGFVAGTITARVKVQRKGDKGLESKIFSGTKAVSAASSDGDLGSTINVVIPAAALVPGVSFGVVLNAKVTSEAPKGLHSARYPRDGALADFGVAPGGDVLKVVLVPMRYQGDGSGRLPDTSATQVEFYRDQFFRKYPVARVDIRIHAPIDYSSVVTHDAGIGDMLNVIGGLHTKEKAADNEYYIGLLQPAAKFWDFCGSGCVAGLSFVGSPSSVWWGYSGADWAAGVGAHEVGHAHGLPHAPCGTTDPDFWPSDADHQSAKLGSWGWDPVEKKLFDPGGDANESAKGTYRDVMSYCGPTWIGDFNYAKLWHRVQADNGVKAADIVGAAPTFESVFIDETGRVTWQPEAVTWQSWMENGQPKSITVLDADGKEAVRTGYYFPYDHLPGGHMLVPTEKGRRLKAIRHASRFVFAAP